MEQVFGFIMGMEWGREWGREWEWGKGRIIFRLNI